VGAGTQRDKVAPGESGNGFTEDMASLFASMGVPTSLDFEQLIALRACVAQWLDGETPHGTVWRAGLPKTMCPEAPRAGRAVRLGCAFGSIARGTLSRAGPCT